MVVLIERFSRNRELLFSTGLSLLARVISAIAAFIMCLVVGRVLGVEESGYYFLAFSIVSFMAGFSRIGLDLTLLRFVGSAFSEHNWKFLHSVMSKALLLTGLSSTLVALLLYLSSGFLATMLFDKPQLAPVLAAMAPGVSGIAIFTLLAMGLQGVRKTIASVLTLNILCNAFIVALLLWLGPSTAIFVGGIYSIAALLTVGSGVYLWRAALRHLHPLSGSLTMKADTINWNTLLQSCMPLWMVLIMGQLIQWCGQFVAGAFVSPGEVAQLAVAQRTAMLTSLVLMAVNLVVAPRFSALHSQGKIVELKNLALTSTKLMVLFALPIVLVMLVFSEWLMSLFGEGFGGGAHLLRILVIGQFINVATGSVGYLLSMSGYEKDLRNTVLLAGPVAVGLAFALVPLWGAAGSAIATSAALATQNLMAVWQVKRRLGFNTLAAWRS